jgi:hypothetical protein
MGEAETPLLTMEVPDLEQLHIKHNANNMYEALIDIQEVIEQTNINGQWNPSLATIEDIIDTVFMSVQTGPDRPQPTKES